MTNSMTAFASRTGNLGRTSWNWEMRGVNARGLDLRLRMPDGFDELEAAFRGALAKALARGNVTVNLRVNREDAGVAATLDEPQLDAVLLALDAIQDRAFTMGVTLGQPTSADVLKERGVLVVGKSDEVSTDLIKALKADIDPLVTAFVDMRKAEGALLHEVVLDQLTQIEVLATAAAKAAADRAPQVKANLTAALRRVLEDVTEIDEARIAQELAILAVKSDVTEEIDRLQTHVQAARDLLDADAPAGRKLDFLAQEFNREANTLCAKAQSAALTAIGLDLKAVIDQMREQIQNVE